MTTSRTLDSPLTTFRAAYDARSGPDGSWLSPLREAAFTRFAHAGLPRRQEESWRYLDLSPLEEMDLRYAVPHPAPLTAVEVRAALESAVGHVADSTLQRLETLRLVFVDGWFARDLSTAGSLREHGWIRPLGPSAGTHAALETHREEIEPYLSARSPVLDTPFAALNSALFQDGIYLRVPRGERIPFVVHLVHVTTSRATACHPRHVLVVEPGGSVSVVSDHVSWSALSAEDPGTAARRGAAVAAMEHTSPYLSNPVLQIRLEDSAGMHLYKLVREHEQSYHLGATSVVQGRDSRFTAFSLVRGGRLVRHDLECRQEAEGAETVLHGLNVLCGTQIADDHTTMVHARPHGSSREFYKTILDDRAEGVFHGKVMVAPGAVGTNAQQSSKNLLLSADALMNTEPQLEISTDDVKCGHGATIGQLDAEALFYLRSRGLELMAARALLTQAFASDIVAAIPEEMVRELVQGYLTFPLCRRPGRIAPRSES